MPSPSKKRVTLKDIARALGVSSATVSMALRNDPHIAESTRTRVKEVADSLGYRPDPHLSQLMGYLREGRTQLEGTVLGLITDWTEAELREHPYMSGLLRGIDERAKQLGYTREIFTRTSRMSYRRIEGILAARSIQGVLVLPHKTGSFEIADFDFASFTAVGIGYGLIKPEIHRTASQQTRAAMLVVREIVSRGYRRIGLVLDRLSDARTEHRHLSGFLGQMAASGCSLDIPVLMLENHEPECLRAWLKQHRPEAIVSGSQSPAVMLKGTGLTAGREIGFAMVNYYGEESVARVQTPYYPMGLAAVNFLHGLLCSYEKGIPETPQVLSVPGTWRPGDTLPEREALAPWPKK